MITKNLLTIEGINVCEDLTDAEKQSLKVNLETGREINGETMKVIIHQQNDITDVIEN